MSVRDCFHGLDLLANTFRLTTPTFNHFILIYILILFAVIGCGSEELASRDNGGSGEQVDEASSDGMNENPADNGNCDEVPVFGNFERGETPDGASIEPTQLLGDAIGGSKKLSRAALEGSDLLTDQVKIAVRYDSVFHKEDSPDPSDFNLDEILDDAGAEIFFASGTVGGVEIDWFKFFSGDTELGAVFAAGTL